MKPQSSPLYLTAKTVIQSNSQGGPNTLSLKNPDESPMELLAIRWILRPLDDTQANFSGTTIGCKLDLGSLPLTNGHVPVPLFGPATLFGAENRTSEALIYEWKLDHPLLIPGGAVVVPTFEHRGLVKTGYEIEIAYSCRTVSDSAARKKLRGIQKVPYISFWASRGYDMLNGVLEEDVSRETDLINRFDQPIHVHRFIGRFDTTFLQDKGVPLDPPVLGELSTSYGSLLYEIRMSDNQGETLIPRYTNFRQVFSTVTRSWEAPHLMAPQRFYRINARKLVAGDPQPNENLGQAFVGMIATREVGGTQ